MDVFKNVIKKERAENEVLSFQPKNLTLGLSDSAKIYLNEENRKKSDFVLSELIAQQTGVSNVESEAQKSLLEQEVLKKLQETQEGAYREAFELGKEEGAKAAFEEVRGELEKKLAAFSDLLREIGALRSHIIKNHEKEIIELVFQVGKKIALKDLKEDSGVIKDLVSEILLESEKHEEIKISLSESDNEFIQKQISGGEFNFAELNKVKFVVDPSVTNGGCRIQTEYGSIDSQVERRVENAWDALKSRMPRT